MLFCSCGSYYVHCLVNTMQPAQVQQQQVIYTTSIPASATVITLQAPPTVHHKVHHDFVLGFKREASRAMGGLMILTALTSYAGATMAIIVYAANYDYYDGYWCGSSVSINYNNY